MPEITPEFIADPANAEHLHEQAMNTSNTNPQPTTKVPVKSQDVDGPTADSRALDLHEAGQAVVDPSPPAPAIDESARSAEAAPSDDPDAAKPAQRRGK